ALGTVLDVIAAMPRASIGAGRPTSDGDLERMRVERTNRPAWTEALRAGASTDEAVAYAWLSFMCGSSDAQARDLSRDALLAVAAPFHDPPLIAYRAEARRALAGPALEKLAAADPRFVEIAYFAGQLDVAQQK